MELKPLKSTDVWQMTRVLKRFNLKQVIADIDKDLVKKASYKPPMQDVDGKLVPLPVEQWTSGQKKAFQAAQEAKDALTWQVLGLVMDNIGACEDDIARLLSGATGESVEAVKDLPAQEYLELIVQYVTREDFADFFTFALDLLGKQKSVPNSIASAVTSIK